MRTEKCSGSDQDKNVGKKQGAWMVFIDIFIFRFHLIMAQ
jgi:hypothetical protein